MAHRNFKKSRLVLAEDCAGLGPLPESCKLLGLLLIEMINMCDISFSVNTVKLRPVKLVMAVCK